MSRRVGFARWRSDAASGGNRYDDELAAGLRLLGVDLREYAVEGPWPLAESEHHLQLRQILTAEQHWLIDNIVGSAAPEAIAEAVERGCRITLLVHYFPSDDPSLTQIQQQELARTEAATIKSATQIVAASSWAATQIAARYGRDDVIAAIPGVELGRPARGWQPPGSPHLLWLARLTHGKDPLAFIDALARLDDLDWTAELVGPDTLDPDLTSVVRRRIDEAGLNNRIGVAGTRVGTELEATWVKTDLFVHTARSEVYGMVVAEALAHGIPAVVPAGTGAVEAQRVGETFPPGDSAALAQVLRRWLTEPRLRDEWRRDALRQRESLQTWQQTAQIVRDALVS